MVKTENKKELGRQKIHIIKEWNNGDKHILRERQRLRRPKHSQKGRDRLDKDKETGNLWEPFFSKGAFNGLNGKNGGTSHLLKAKK